MPILDGLFQGVLRRMADDIGGWIASLIVWAVAVTMSLAIVCVLLGPAE